MSQTKCMTNKWKVSAFIPRLGLKFICSVCESYKKGSNKKDEFIGKHAYALDIRFIRKLLYKSLGNVTVHISIIVT